MDIHRKKVLLISLDNALTNGGELTEFTVRRDVLDRIRSLNISRVAIIYGDSDDADFYVKVKSVEFFVFAYCKLAVSTHKDGANIIEELMAMLPHNMRKKDLFLSVGEKIGNIDNITLEDFLA